MREKTKAVLVRIPDGIFQKVKKLVEMGEYRNTSDFFYVAGHKELDRATRRAKVWTTLIDVDSDCEIQEAEQ